MGTPDGISVVKHLNSAELAAWRRQNNVAKSPVTQAQRQAPVTAEIEKSAPQMELPGPEIMQELIGEWWGNMTRDRVSYQRGIAWLRARVPHAVGHLSDRDLLEYLNGLARDAAKRHASGQGRPTRDVGSGRYAVR